MASVTRPIPIPAHGRVLYPVGGRGLGARAAYAVHVAARWYLGWEPDFESSCDAMAEAWARKLGCMHDEDVAELRDDFRRMVASGRRVGHAAGKREGLEAAAAIVKPCGVPASDHEEAVVDAERRSLHASIRALLNPPRERGDHG